MKNLFTLLLIVFFFQANAQFFSGQYYQFVFYPYSSQVNWYGENTKLKEQKITEVIETSKDEKSGEFFKVKEYKLNNSGRIIEYNQFSKKGKKIKLNIHCDFQNNLMNEMRAQKANGDTIYITRYTYKNNKEISRDYFNKNKLDVPNWRLENQYNDSGKLIMSQSFRKGKLNYRYEYEFYPNGSKKETRYYNSKNKLKYRYTYECDPKGELEDKEVKNRNYCVKKDIKNDGSYMEISEYKNEKGKVTKYIRYYSSDSLLTQSENYNFKGEMNYKTTYQYNSNRQVTKHEDSNKKGLLYTNNFEYNQQGLFAKGSRIDKKGKETYEWKLEYKN